MYHWNTENIVKYLETISEIERVENDGPGGDVDTDNIYCKVRGSDEGVFVCGFSVDNAITDPSNCDVEMIEVTDNSGDGLQTDDYGVAKVYIMVRQHFVGAGATVVPRLKDYF